MPLNLLEYGTRTANILDKKFVADSVTGFLEANGSDIQFMDEKTVLLSSIDMSGMGDYDRSNGFAKGSLSEVKTPYTLSMDRGRSFTYDAMDEKEAGIKGAEYMAEFQRTKAAPEIDAYALSKLRYWASQAGNVTSTSVSTSNAIATLITLINACKNVVGASEELVVFTSMSFRTLLDTSAEYTRYINVGDFAKGGVSTKVMTVNGVPTIEVQDALMYSSYDFLNGVDDTQYNGGFVAHSGATMSDFIVMPKKAAKLVTKTKKIRVFSPDVNQLADAWKMDYRRYYDVVCSAEKQKTIFANY